MRYLGLFAVAALLFTATLAKPAHASTVAAFSNELGNGTDPFTPSWSPISTANDVLFGASPSSSTGDFGMESAGGIPILTDGAVGPIFSSANGSHANLATVGNDGSGSLITYTFAPTQLTSIAIYGGWNDAGRDEANFQVAYSTNGGATFTQDLGFSVDPANPNGVQDATRTIFTDNASSTLFGGALVNALQISFILPNATVENGHVGISEIAAYAPVPEPSTFALLSLGAVGLFIAARRRK